MNEYDSDYQCAMSCAMRVVEARENDNIEKATTEAANELLRSEFRRWVDSESAHDVGELEDEEPAEDET
ncbi:MAG: hypothetical protein ACREML_01915 [Vulcanimicrobiaceae bacterium]